MGDDFITPIAQAAQGSCLGASLEKSFSQAVDSLTGCGTGTTILFLLLVISVVGNVLQQRNTNKIISSILRVALKGDSNVGDDEN